MSRNVKHNVAQAILARKTQVERAVQEQGVALKLVQLQKSIASYEVAKSTAKQDAIKRAAVALEALSKLLAFAEEKGLEGEAVNFAQLVLTEYEIVPLENRVVRKKNEARDGSGSDS